MGHVCFDVSIEDQIAHIVMKRPEKRNSMIPEFWDELPAIIEDIDFGAKARVIVISSTGPHFTAGLDISAFGGSDADSPVDPGAGKLQRPVAFLAIVSPRGRTHLLPSLL